MAAPAACSPPQGQPRRRCFYLLRHAESGNNAKGHHDGHQSSAKGAREPDPGITAQGEGQAASAAECLLRIRDAPGTQPGLQPRELYCSPMRRATESCVPVAAALALAPVLHTELHEEGGCFEGPRRGRSADPAAYAVVHGRTPAELRAALPGFRGTEAVPECGWWRGGKETEDEGWARAGRVAAWMWRVAFDGSGADGAGAGAIVCVGHGLFMSRLLTRLLCGSDDPPPGCYASTLLTANSAYWLIELIEGAGDAPRKVGFLACNDVEHVPISIRTGHSCRGFKYCAPGPRPRGEGAAGGEEEEGGAAAAKRARAAE